MSGALRYEWLRLRTVRSTYILVVLCLVFTGLVAWGSANNLDRDQVTYAQALASGSSLPPLLLGIVGVFAFGHEYRFGMIRPTLTALPRRSQVAAAKVVMVLGLTLVTAVACVGVAYVVTSVVAKDTTGLSLTGGHTERVVLGAIAWTVLFAMVGIGYGLLFRNVPAALGILIVVPLVVENIVLGLLQIDALKSIRGIGDYLPFSAGTRMFSWDSASADGGTQFGSQLSPLAGGLTFTAFAVIILALAWVLFEKRDA